MRNSRLSDNAITVASTSDEPITGATNLGAVAAKSGNTSTAMPATTDKPMTKVRRASSRREVMTCRPLIMIKVTTSISADTMTGRGITASSAGNLGKNPRMIKSPPTA